MSIAYFRFKYSVGNSGALIGYYGFEFSLKHQKPLNRDFLYKQLENYIIRQNYKLIGVLSLEMY